MANGHRCVRCGHEQEKHDTNLVLEPEAFLEEISAREVEQDYEMSLLSCTNTNRPEVYVEAIEQLCGLSPPVALGNGET